MKKNLAAAVLICLIAAAGWAQDARPDFSGTWTLDLAKSDFGPTPPPESMVLVVEHQDPNLKTTNTQKGQQGETKTERTLTTDGKENINKMRTMAGDQDVKSTTKWNGSKLETAFKLDAGGMTVDIADAWELSPDGKVFTIVRDLKTPQGDFTQKLIFNKQ